MRFLRFTTYICFLTVFFCDLASNDWMEKAVEKQFSTYAENGFFVTDIIPPGYVRVTFTGGKVEITPSFPKNGHYHNLLQTFQDLAKMYEIPDMFFLYRFSARNFLILD